MYESVDDVMGVWYKAIPLALSIICMADGFISQNSRLKMRHTRLTIHVFDSTPGYMEIDFDEIVYMLVHAFQIRQYTLP